MSGKFSSEAGIGPLYYTLKVKTDLALPGQYSKNTPLRQSSTLDTKSKNTPPGKELVTKGPKESPDYKIELNSKKTTGVKLPEIKAPEIKAQEINPTEIAKSEIKKEAASAVNPGVRPGTLKKDAIIFIKGLDIFSSPSKSEMGYAGIGKMAEAVEGARIYGWGQKDEIMKEVLKAHPDYKVVLVGHSFGGDTAVEVANELNDLENKFRSVDLLITLDAVGLNNDIIPQNVKRHLNVFGENDFLLNDGPHVARRNEKTHVENILSPLGHTDIDDDKEIQYEVINLIQKTLNSSVS